MLILYISPPFTGFTFFNQTPYSSVIQSEGPFPLFRLHALTRI